MTLGDTDVGLTRLSGALADSRKLPSVLRDTLAFVAWAESEAGIFDNVRRYQRELSDYIFDDAIRKVSMNVELAQALDGARPARRQASEYWQFAYERHGEKPAEWDMLYGLASTASLRIDRRGIHGRDVGALTKALAVEVGIAHWRRLKSVSRRNCTTSACCRYRSSCHWGKGRCRRMNATWSTGIATRGSHAVHCRASALGLGERHCAIPPRALGWRRLSCRRSGRRHSIGARLCAVADAYDSMVTSRSWRQPMTMDAALAELGAAAGSQLDPDLVRKFDAMIRRESDDIGVDPALDPESNGFETLIDALTEDRGSP